MSTPSRKTPHITAKDTHDSASAKPTGLRARLLIAALAAMLCLGMAGCGLIQETLGSSPSKENQATTQAQGDQDGSDESTVALSAEDLAAAEDRGEAGLAEDETMDDPSVGDEVEPAEITLVAVGDSLIHEEVYTAQKSGKGYNFDSLFKHVKKDIKKADIAVINQETIFVKSGYSGYPCFGSPMALGDSIAKAGFDVVQHATNHTMDRGAGAVRATMKYWKKKHPEMKVLGIHSSKKDAKKITVMERNGIKVAMLNYTYGTNGIPVPEGQGYLVDRLKNKKKIANDIKRAKAKSDIVVVFAHFGTEYRYKPDGSQRMWAKWFAKKGVDVLIGTHPHVLEPVKYVKGKNGHKMLCYYSLGNFVSCQSTTDTMLGGMAKVKIKKDQDGTRVSSYDLIPLVTQMGAGTSKKYTVYKLRDYTPALAQSNPIRGIVGGEFTVKNLKKLYKQITGRKA